MNLKQRVESTFLKKDELFLDWGILTGKEVLPVGVCFECLGMMDRRLDPG